MSDSRYYLMKIVINIFWASDYYQNKACLQTNRAEGFVSQPQVGFQAFTSNFLSRLLPFKWGTIEGDLFYLHLSLLSSKMSSK